MDTGRDISTNDVTGKVVIVNDSETQLTLLGGILRKAGFETVCFISAEDALAGMSENGVPSLVVTDVYMPVIDGWQFCRLLRSGDFSFLNHVPILVASATFAGDQTEQITAELGADAFLACPVDANEFVSVVQELIEGRYNKRKRRVLLVEDDEMFRDVIVRGMERDGYEVVAVATLAEAEHAYHASSFDLAILDENLPDGQGSDLVRRVNSPSASCAFVMMSGNTSSGHYLDWMKAGVSASIPKPFKIAYLLEVCGRARRERSLLRTETLLEIRTQELLRRDTEYRSLVAGMPDAFLRFDREGRCLFVSDNAKQLLGIGTEYAGMLIASFPLTASLQELWETSLAQVFAGGETVEVEFTFTVQGEDRIFNWRLVPEYPAGSVTGVTHSDPDQICSVVTFARDITLRRRSELNYQVLFKEMLSGFALHEVICDDEGRPVDYRFLGVNPAFETITGLDAKDIVGRTVLDVLPETEPEWIARYGHVALTGEAERFEAYSKAVSKWFSVNAYSPERGQFACVFEDITVQKLGEIEQEKLNHALAQAQKMETVGRLAGGIAHDFNNMLSVIMGNVELAIDLLEGNDSILEFLQETLDAAVRSAEITRQLLAFSRRQPISPQVMNLNEQVTKTTKMLGRLIGETVTLEWVPSDDLWHICMDASQIDQLLVNLCVNARDAFAGNSGSIVISTSNCALDAFFCSAHIGSVPGEYVRLRVRDNGPGMDADVLEHLFEPFFTTKDQGKGTGLGLATVYGIVKQNEGYVAVDSKVGEGATFDVYIPRYVEDGAPVADAAAPSLDISKAHGEMVLVVEDEESVRQICMSQLSKAGFEVLCAADAAAAIDLAREHAAEIRVVLTDLMMPGENGASLIQSLRVLCPKAGFVLMSGYADGVFERERKTYDLSDVFIMQKPFSRRELLVALFEQLDKQAAKASVAPPLGETLLADTAENALAPDSVADSQNQAMLDIDARSRQIAVDLLRVHTMESVGRLAGAMLHETNNQLMVMRWYVEQALEETSPDSLTRQWLDKISEAVTASVKMNHAAWSRNILAFSANQDVLPERLNLNEALLGVEAQMQELVAPRTSLCVRVDETPVWCFMDPAQIDQILVALCLNARDAIPADRDGQIEIATCIVDVAEDLEKHAGGDVKSGRYACVSVRDNGTGIGRDVRKNMFDPFFSTKDRHQAVGLGLTIVDGVTRQNHGCVRVETSLDMGTTMRVYLPLCAAKEDASRP